MPEKEESQYPYIGMSVEEYHCFVENAARLVVEGINGYKGKVIIIEEQLFCS